MSVVRHICHDVTVLSGGGSVDRAPRPAGHAGPRAPVHPRTPVAAPVADPAVQRKRRAIAAAGEPTNGDPQPGSGCPFAARCPVAQERCRQTRPEARPTADGRTVACHRYPDWRSEITTDITR
ncbi:oligopeptide/dipeptide ABC transporter ATP-binding protein [Streptomyces shaanxiensis]